MKPPAKIPCGVTVKFDNAIFLEILDRYGVQGWNSWIDAISNQNLLYPSYDTTENPPPFQVDFVLSGIDLSNRELDGIDLTMVYMSHGVLCHSSLYGAKFLLANQCNFVGADLRTATFESCDVSGAVFVDSMLGNNDWTRAFYYVGQPPSGLPSEIMTKLKQLEPDDYDVAKPKQIVCLADVKDASHWVEGTKSI